jgi:hypothetical protein
MPKYEILFRQIPEQRIRVEAKDRDKAHIKALKLWNLDNRGKILETKKVDPKDAYSNY